MEIRARSRNIRSIAVELRLRQPQTADRRFFDPKGSSARVAA